jgi:hypothetical protein
MIITLSIAEFVFLVLFIAILFGMVGYFSAACGSAEEERGK